MNFVSHFCNALLKLFFFFAHNYNSGIKHVSHRSRKISQMQVLYFQWQSLPTSEDHLRCSFQSWYLEQVSKQKGYEKAASKKYVGYYKLKL